MLMRPVCRNVVVKWVRMGLALEWIAANFPELQVVQIIRHPIPQFLSWRQRGWNPGLALDRLLRQEQLMHGPLRPYGDVMRTAGGFWEQAAAFWCACACMQYRADRPGWETRASLAARPKCSVSPRATRYSSWRTVGLIIGGD